MARTWSTRGLLGLAVPFALACGPSGVGPSDAETSGDGGSETGGTETTLAPPCDGLDPCPDDSCPPHDGEWACCDAGGPCPACTEATKWCLVDATCCEGLACNEDVNQCQPCVGEGGECGSSPCCTGTCTNPCGGVCVTCLALGDPCDDDLSCCGAACIEGSCAECRETGLPCDDHLDGCASDYCDAGTCTAEPGPACDGAPDPIDTGPSLRCVGACDTTTQDCAPGTEECAVVDSDKDGVLDIAQCREDCGDKGLGEACMRGLQEDDCGFALFCLADEDVGYGAGRCHAYCEGQGGDLSCPGDDVCASLYGDNLRVCLSPCDPNNGDQDCAGTSHTCTEHDPGEFGCTPS